MPIERPFTLWLMGPTSSGKSTIAESFIEVLTNNDILILHYDGDEVRNFFGKDYGFNENHRGRIVETLAYLARKVNDAGVDVVVSALTAHRSARNYIKVHIPNLLVGYVECPIDVCAERDPKGLYKKARNGEIDTLIGYNSKYLAPSDPNKKLDTNNLSVEENTMRLIEFLEIA